VLELLTPRTARLRVRGLEPGGRPVCWDAGERSGQEVEGARCALGTILELGVPFACLGLEVGQEVELLGTLVEGDEARETLPADDLVRFTVPGSAFESWMWSA
jgi:hypothetical protein